MGGPSTEREISLKSGKAVYEALEALGLDVVAIDITSDNIEENLRLLKSGRLDCAFVALHGRFGEDGQIQDILERLHVPYSGSGVSASRLAMDKISSRRIFQENGLAVPPCEVVEKVYYADGWSFDGRFPPPLVVKPAGHGSSIGLSLVDKISELPVALDNAFAFDNRVIIEKYIKGRELTVGILGESPLPVIEIIPKQRFFDYHAKYHAGITEYVVPAKLEGVLNGRVQEAALASHRLLGCFGCSRVDIILDSDNIPVILEVNTIPGFTATSLLPKAAGVAGIDFGALCVKLLESAYEKNRVSDTV